MKSVLNLFLLALLFFEILSPFIIGYLDAATKTTYVIKTEKTKEEAKPKTSQQTAKINDLELFDESFADSKSIRFREILSQGR